LFPPVLKAVINGRILSAIIVSYVVVQNSKRKIVPRFICFVYKQKHSGYQSNFMFYIVFEKEEISGVFEN